MEDWKLPTYSQARDSETAADDDETLLQGSEQEESEDGEKAAEGSVMGSRRSMKSTFWVVLMTMATLAGRRVLGPGFRESIPSFYPWFA